MLRVANWLRNQNVRIGESQVSVGEGEGKAAKELEAKLVSAIPVDSIDDLISAPKRVGSIFSVAPLLTD